MRKKWLSLSFAFLAITLVAPGIQADLRFSEWQQDKQGSTLLAGNETSLAISPDGRNLYAAGRIEDAIVVFDRDTSTGAVSLNSIAREAEGGLTGLKSPASVVLSPNGKFVYVAGRGSSSITVFNRKADGSLAANRMYDFSTPGYGGLHRPQRLYLTPDGTLMFVYTLDAIKPRPIRIDTTTGLFTTDYQDYNYVWEDIKSDGTLSISKSGQHVFSVERRLEKVLVNSTNQNILTEIGEAWKIGIPDDIENEPMHVVVSPDEKFLYLSMQGAPAILIMAKNAQDWNYAYKDSILYRKARTYDTRRAPLMLLSEDAGQLYVSQADDSHIAVYTRNAASGGLTFRMKAPLFLEPGTVNPEGALAMVASRDGKNVYVLPHWSHNLQAFTRDPVSGDLHPLARLNVGKSGIEGLSRPAGLVMSPDGRLLFSLPGNRDAVNCFARDPQTGHLTWVSTSPVNSNPLANSSYSDGGHLERRAVFSPDGRYLYEARPFEFTLATYAVGTDGSATLAAANSTQTSGEAHAYSDAFLTGDGQTLFVSDNLDSTLTAWKRTPASGMLQFQNQYENGASQMGFRGLTGRNGMIGSPDNRFLYVTSAREKAVSVFIREEGHLEWLQTEKHHLTENTYGESFAFLALSPDGNQLYTAERLGNAVQVFDRDSITGKLHFRESFGPDTSVTQTQGLVGITGMAMSPDGSALYLSAKPFHSLIVLNREPIAGKLSHLKTFFNGKDGVDGFYNAGSLVVSPEGRHLYVASVEGNSVAIFQNDAIPSVVGVLGKPMNGTNAAFASVRGRQLQLKGLAPGAFHVSFLSLDGRKLMEAGGWADMYGRAEVEFSGERGLGLYIAAVRQGDLFRSQILKAK